MKAYTDIDQSKKLAEILPLESADMARCGGENVIMTNYISAKKKFSMCGEITITPCWSLAVLLSVLPFHLIVNNQGYAFSMHKGLNIDGETYMIRYNVFNTDICLYSTDYCNNPIDACYEMIVELHEQKLL